MSEHVAFSDCIGKNFDSSKNSDVRDHMLICDSFVSFEYFSVLANETNDFKTKFQESLLIHHDGSQ